MARRRWRFGESALTTVSAVRLAAVCFAASPQRGFFALTCCRFDMATPLRPASAPTVSSSTAPEPSSGELRVRMSSPLWRGARWCHRARSSGDPYCRSGFSGRGRHAQGPPRGRHAQGPPRGRHAQGPPRGRHAQGPPRGRHAQGPPRGRHAQGPPRGRRAQGPPRSRHTQGPPRGRHALGSKLPRASARPELPGGPARPELPGGPARPEVIRASARPALSSASARSEPNKSRASASLVLHVPGYG